MPMAPLPVPDLDESLARFADTVSAIATPQEYDAAKAAISRFRVGRAEELQRTLELVAEREYDAGGSWLSREWSRGYLGTRGPLTLASNVGFELNLPDEAAGTGAERVAARIHRIAAVHITEARGETEQEIDGRGTAMSMAQWPSFNGGVRHPQPEVDTIIPCELDAAEREIGVLRAGRLFTLRVSDREGRPLGTRSLATGIARIVELADGATGMSTLGFVDPSYLGSDLADVLGTMLEDAHNALVYRRLSELLFTVTLTDEFADDAEELRAVLVDPVRAWVNRPFSYQLSPNDGRVFMHAEHSVFDGGTLAEAVRRMQQVEPDLGDDLAPPEPMELTWRLDAAQRGTLREGLAVYRHRAAELRVEIVRVPRVPDDRLPFRMSADAQLQVMLNVAQQLTFGRVRSAYESVDMRAFQAGRTDCLRPVTPEATAFARRLIAGDAGPDDFVAALNAHREWVKACKTGRGFDRHFTGLAMIARHLGITEPFFDCDALTAVRTDLLSTTSLGTPDYVIRFTFPPTVPHGFGVAYTQYPDGFEFCVSYNAGRTEQPERFLANLPEAARLVNGFITGLPSTPS